MLQGFVLGTCLSGNQPRHTFPMLAGSCNMSSPNSIQGDPLSIYIHADSFPIVSYVTFRWMYCIYILFFPLLCLTFFNLVDYLSVFEIKTVCIFTVTKPIVKICMLHKPFIHLYRVNLSKGTINSSQHKNKQCYTVRYDTIVQFTKVCNFKLFAQGS